MFYCVINKEGVSVTFDTPSCCCKINNPSVYEDISQDAPILISFIMYSTMCLSFTGYNSMLSSPACLYVCVLSDNFSAVLFNQCAEGLS